MIEMQKNEKFDGMVFFEVLNFDWATMEYGKRYEQLCCCASIKVG